MNANTEAMNNTKNVPVKLFSEESYGLLGITSAPVLEELEETLRIVCTKMHSQMFSKIMSETAYPVYLTVACNEFDDALKNLSAAFGRYSQIEAANKKVQRDKDDGFYKARHGN